ncbi:MULTISPECIES: hypothetical protein [Trueperella]|uniref:YdhG-like domain-containing protein n=1 Tax=Trueperella bernardiae TaxID=59561 RepID=A0A0W1KM44_9ACTO|nr:MULTISPECIES: hypothetical protein [Trueperella]KTF04588.1 hypothetical protein AQZ59_00573 [Trueperella bernardiae]MCM3906888.1 hypothetical protein [Trueperella bernardiae]MDK8601802.1 hypothetical protein [Trueperella bernardiae]MDV6238411.1 hypothetical protein [Trueperella bernardiae]OFS74315.1 hypothetical protein HMPREF3167_05560 [Trueperella sp. HMSC08B05]
MEAQTRLDPCEVVDRFPAELQADARALYGLLKSVTGHEAVMWGPSVIGFGEKVPVCVDESSPDGFEIGFSRRGTKLVLVLRRYSEYYAPILARLGSVPFGRNAIVLPAFDELDESVLRELIETAWEDRTRAD